MKYPSEIRYKHLPEELGEQYERLYELRYPGRKIWLPMMGRGRKMVGYTASPINEGVLDLMNEIETECQRLIRKAERYTGGG